MRRRIPLGLAPGLLCLVAACGASAEAGFTSADTPSLDAGASAPAPAPGVAADAGAPPEREVESAFEAPVATGNFVWVANPKSGRVAYIDVRTLVVKTVDAGNGPTYLAAVPGQSTDTTVVLNVLSSDASVLRAGASGIDVKSFKVAKDANAWAFSADGRYAIAWADAKKRPGASRTEGFQDLTVIDLVAGTPPTVLAVGYRPVLVGFARGAPLAHAVTQDGVAIVDLSASPPRVVRNVAISATPTEDPGTRDVAVTPDGKTALVRRDGAAQVTVVSLESGQRVDVTLGGPVTDLDLSEAGDKAVAVVRSTGAVSVLPVPGVLTQPTSVKTVTVTGETIGSVVLSSDGNTAMLYTNASQTERITVMNLAATPDPTYRVVKLYSPVLAAFASPDARHATILHDLKTQDGAFSLVPLANDLPAKIVAMKARPTQVAMTADVAIVAERGDTSKIYGAYLAKLPSFQVERFALASPPIAVGVVPAAKRAFVAQEHPEGRITFLDLDTGLARTLTGFELASRVVDGSKP